MSAAQRGENEVGVTVVTLALGVSTWLVATAFEGALAGAVLAAAVVAIGFGGRAAGLWGGLAVRPSAVVRPATPFGLPERVAVVEVTAADAAVVQHPAVAEEDREGEAAPDVAA